MVIHTPKIKIEGDGVSVRARVEFQTPVSNMPDELWFKFPGGHRDWVTDRADGFVAAMLLLAMEYGEDIEVRGALSPRLLSGMQEYQRIFNMWFPRRFKLINIHCDNYAVPGRGEVAGAVACAFSGGVDSFYTLWSRLPQNERNRYSQVSHALFVHGFDNPLELPKWEAAFHTARESFEGMMKGLGVSLLTASTNIQHFDTRRDWGLYHGSALIGLALVLGRLLTRFYVPSSHTYNDLMPWGSDPRIDHLLSTETLEAVHDGASMTRFEKIAVIARWPETFTRLRVCIPAGLHNCSRCEKCVRTMVMLDMVGALSNYTTFTLPLEGRMMRRCRYYTVSDFAFAREIIRYAAKMGRWDIAVNIGYALLCSRLYFFWKKRIKKHFRDFYKKLRRNNKSPT